MSMEEGGYGHGDDHARTFSVMIFCDEGWESSKELGADERIRVATLCTIYLSIKILQKQP